MSAAATDDAAALADFMAELGSEFPRFTVVAKEGNVLSRAIDVALRVVTFNQMRTYLTRFHTVIGDTLYVPPGWDTMGPRDKVILLRHERVHLRQRRRYGFIGMAIAYLLLPLPLGLAYARARMEWEAYAETVSATMELCGPRAARSPSLRAHIISQFTSANYGWMWPFPRAVGRWYDDLMVELGLD
ncbi:MAG: hypothetical protein AAF928_03810 [Myxococcota bacterium]